MKEITVDTDKILKAFEQLSTKNMASIHKSALTKGATIVRRDIRKEIRKTFKNKGDKYKDMYKGGVQITKRKSGNLVKVHLFGTDKFYHSYILRFYAGGTEERYAKYRRGRSMKKNAYRGSIKKIDLFSQVNYDNVYKEINNTLGKNILKRFNNGK